MSKKYLIQSIGVLCIGILIYLAGDWVGIIPAILIPLGIIIAIAGGVAFILALILRDPDEISPGKTG
jgi:ABC-type Fe3+-siderophore transport system permease subunit